MGRHTNIGHLVMSGLLNQADHGHSKHVKSSATGVHHPNVEHLRYWEKKLVAAFNTVETIGKTVNVFEARLLEDLSLSEGNQGLEKNGPGRVKTPEKVLDAAEKSVQRMISNLKRAKDGLRLAEKGAILPKDMGDVKLAKEALLDLDGIVNGIANRIQELKRELGLDSTL